MDAVKTGGHQQVATEVGTTGDQVSGPEAAVRRVLRAPVSASADEAGAHRLFSVSILLSAARCLATYIILPIAVPLIGTSVTTNAAVGLPLTLLAIVFDVRAVRRFWLADHRLKWWMTALYAVVMALVIGLAVQEVSVL